MAKHTKRTMISAEQAAENILRNGLEDLRESFHMTSPSVIYNLGDRVQHGNIKESIVTEVLDNGCILKLHEIVTEHNYGRPFDIERDMYVAWYDLVPYRTHEENAVIPSLITRGQIQLNFMQMSTMSIFTYYYHSGIDMDPDYQRGNVWTLEDKVELIQSIFNNVDIGKFVLIQLDYKADSPGLEVLDGKQRITALVEFLENRFQVNGYFYKDLCSRDQSHFDDYPVAIALIKNATPKQKLDYFLRLNTSGHAVDKNHLAKVRAMYDSINEEGI
jgi:hypothetical protein